MKLRLSIPTGSNAVLQQDEDGTIWGIILDVLPENYDRPYLILFDETAENDQIVRHDEKCVNISKRKKITLG